MHPTGRSGDLTTPEGESFDGVTSVLPRPVVERPGIRRQAPRAPGGRSWRALFFAPVGDGQTRRRGSDAVRLGLAVLLVVLCWVMTRANSSAEHVVASTMSSAPEGIRWVVTAVWWIASVGLIAVTAALAIASRRWSVARDVGLTGVGAWLICLLLGYLLGSSGGRPPDSLPQFDASFPVALVAATVGVAVAAFPYLSRWLQLTLEVTIGLLAVAAVVHESGLPVAVLASLGAGWGTAALVRLVFGSPLGLPSPAEVGALLGDLGMSVDDLAPSPNQGWGVGRFSGRVAGSRVDVSVYGRDASDAQLLAKTARFAFYRDSGPTLTLTRRQQVEHEAYLTMMAARAGATVPEVLAAGPAGPARDAVLVTLPPAGSLLAAFVAPQSDHPDHPDPSDQLDASDEPPNSGDSGDPHGESPTGNGADPVGATTAPDGATTAPDGATTARDGRSGSPRAAAEHLELDDAALDSVFAQIRALRDGGIAHGALSTRTIVIGAGGQAGLVDMRAACTVATQDQLNRDLAAAIAAVAVAAGPQRTVAAVLRSMPPGDLVDALPYLQRAALDTTASRSLRGKKSLLNALRDEGAAKAGVEVPKLIEPRRISWVTLAMVIGTLIGGWALIGVLINVTKSWSTIAGADWAWVALVFVLAQAAYPAIAVTTVGSVTDPLPYGRTVALEVADTFVALAGGSMAVLATRIRFFQQEGYTPTVAVSSGVLVSTASWIVKGAVFLIALPFAIGNLDLGEPAGESSGDSHLVWLIVIAVALAGVALGLLFAVPRWRRMAAQKIRPKASEVWSHLKLLAGHPRNLVEIFGGSLAAQLFVAMALGAALHAFGDHLSLATLIVVLTLGSMLGGVSPVPGGMGVVEAGMIIGLTAAGIDESVAVAAVFVQRLFTAYLPPIWGWFVMVWMRKKEYL